MSPMGDPWKVHREELRVWAYNAEEPWPDQDFDLSVSEMYFSDLILEFAADQKCPKNKFFLGCAYLLVGDAVMTEYNSRSKDEVKIFLEKAKEKGCSSLDILYERSLVLLDKPETFDYDLWCGEGYSKQEES